MNANNSTHKAEDVLHEIESQRGLYEKHFQLTDGSVIGVAYAYPVHYETDEGYEDVDNTLIKTVGQGTVLCPKVTGNQTIR